MSDIALKQFIKNNYDEYAMWSLSTLIKIEKDLAGHEPNAPPELRDFVISLRVLVQDKAMEIQNEVNDRVLKAVNKKILKELKSSFNKEVR